MKYKLSELSSYVTEKILVSELQEYQYISTDNMVLNRGGIIPTKYFPQLGKVASFKKGDILISNIRPYFKKIWLASFNGGCSNDVLVIRANSKIDNNFLYYVLSSDDFFDYVTATSKDGTKMPRGDRVAVMKYQVPNFSLETQQKIAKILSSLDEKIELNNKINENLHAQAQAIFKSWFVNFEPFKNEKYSDSVLGKIPSKFTVVNLESLCSVITKGTTPTTIKRNFMPCGVNFLKVETILENHDFDKTKFTFIDNETNELMSRSKIKENDILLSMAGTIGRFAIVRNDLLPANINQALAIIREDETKISSYCLYSYFLGGWHTNFYLKKIQQAVQANLSLTSIKSLPILLPNREILQAHEKVIIPIIEKIKNIQVENIKLAQIRDTLLPKLMSGELEV